MLRLLPHEFELSALDFHRQVQSPFDVGSLEARASVQQAYKWTAFLRLCSFQQPLTCFLIILIVVGLPAVR